MPALNKYSIGQMLITSGKIDQSQLRTALDYQEDNSGYIGQALIESGFLTSGELLPYLGRQLKVPYLQLGYYDIDQALVDIVPEKSVRTYKVFPLFTNLHHKQKKNLEINHLVLI